MVPELLADEPEVAGGRVQVPRRRADRPPALLHQIRHDRALLHERRGRHAQARRDFERLYAEVPDFPGVARRLGLG